MVRVLFVCCCCSKFHLFIVVYAILFSVMFNYLNCSWLIFLFFSVLLLDVDAFDAFSSVALFNDLDFFVVYICFSFCVHCFTFVLDDFLLLKYCVNCYVFHFIFGLECVHYVCCGIGDYYFGRLFCICFSVADLSSFVFPFSMFLLLHIVI